MSTLCKLIRLRSWPVAVIVSLATHIVVLSLAAPAVRSGDDSNSHPHLDHPMSRGGSPIAVALVTGSAADEQTKAGQSAAQVVRTIGRGRSRAHAAIPGPAGNNATGREAAATSESNLAPASSWLTEDTTDQGEPFSEKPDSLSGIGTGSGSPSASGRAAATAEGITELHQRLASSAQRCYPPAARRLRLRGEVGLHFCLGADGFAGSRALRGSTGSALLDRATLECVLAGALPVPGIVGCYDVQVRFSDER